MEQVGCTILETTANGTISLVMVKALVVAAVKLVALAVNTLSTPAASIFKSLPLKFAIPATADIDNVPAKFPLPVVNEIVMSLVASEPDVIVLL